MQNFTVIQEMRETCLSQFWVKVTKIWEWKDMIRLKGIPWVNNVILKKEEKKAVS